MKGKLLVAILCISQFGFSNSKIDSLESVLVEYTLEDQGKVDLLNKLGFEYWIVNPTQSIIYGQQAKVLASILSYQAGEAFANRVIGVAHWARGSYDHGLEFLLDGLLGYRNLSDTLGEANCLMNIGLIYADRKDNDLALKYYFEALDLFKSLGAQGRMATTYIKLATIYIDEGRFEEALQFIKVAEFIHGNGQFLYGMSEILNRYGILNIAEGEYDSAILYLGHSLEVSKKIDDVDGVTKSYIDISEAHIQKGDFEKAETSLKEGLVYARQINSHKWLKEIYQRLQLIARSKGDLKQAIAYYDQYVQEKDSIFNEQTLNNLARLEAELATVEQKRQLEAQEKEIVILEQRGEIQRTRFFIVMIVLLMIIAGLFAVVRIRQIKSKRKEDRAKAEAEKVKKELEFKNRELVSYTVNFVQKNQLFDELNKSVSSLKKISPTDVRRDLIGMEKVINRHLQIDKDWEDFKLRFENLHTGFFDKLIAKSPSLTNNDLKLSVLVKMNFSIKEVADMMGISTESVKTARYRLKKKLDLPADTTINDFLNGLG